MKKNAIRKEELEPLQENSESQSDLSKALEKENAGTLESDAENIMQRQFVTFAIGDEIFALPMANVKEIIRMGEMVKVPLAPPSLEGLTNLRGKVLPIINLRHVFKFPKLEHSESTRVVVVDTGVSMGFVVDRVSSVITVENEQIENVDTLEATIESHLLTGMIKNVNKQPMIMLLDAKKLMEEDFAILAKQAANRNSGNLQEKNSEKVSNSAELTSNEIQLVSFSVAEQEYAFPMESVQEIVQIPSSLCHVPKAKSYALGVMSLRNRLLPIVSLRQMFNLPAAALDEHNRIVVISLKTGKSHVSIGIVMDKVKEVLRLQKTQVDNLPAIFTQDKEVQEIEAICRMEEGKRLVSVISVEKLFQHEAVNEALQMQESSEENSMVDKNEVIAEEEDQMVIFKLGNEEYSVRVDSVQEILRLPEQFTHVPKTVSFIEGLISLRGTVLPVIDLRKRFGLDQKEKDERQRIMIFTIKGLRTGMIVDSVSEVFKIAKSCLEDAPSLSEEQSKVIKNVVNLEKQKRMLLVLDIDEILSGTEIAAIKSGVSHDKAASSR